MALPTAVKRRSEQARRMVAERNGGSPPAQSPQPNDGQFLDVGSTETQSTRVVETAPVSFDDPTNQHGDVHPAQHDAAAEIRQPHILDDGYVAGTPTQDPSNVDTGEVTGHISEDDWKARYTALRTSRDDRIATLQSDVGKLTKVNETLSSRLAEVDKPVVSTFELDEDDRASLGADRAKEFDAYRQSVEAQQAKQQEEAAEKRRLEATGFESDLDSLVPNWRKMNTDKRFLEWLNLPDAVMGVRRQDMLDGFVNSRDASSTAALFRSFAGGSAHAQQRNGDVPTLDMDSTRAGSGMGGEEVLVETWDQSEIADFFQKKSRLYQTGKLQGELLNQVQAEESRIRKAMAEGRVDMSR